MSRGSLAAGQQVDATTRRLPALAVPLDPREDFGAVYEAQYQAVFKTVRGIVLDAAVAEDVTQNAFREAYRARDRYRPTEGVDIWLCRIAVREAMEWLRWSASPRSLHAAGGREEEDEEEEELLRPRVSLSEAVDTLLSTLSPVARAVVMLRFLHGYDDHEIADITGIAESTVASRLSQALTEMRQQANR